MFFQQIKKTKNIFRFWSKQQKHYSTAISIIVIYKEFFIRILYSKSFKLRVFLLLILFGFFSFVKANPNQNLVSEKIIKIDKINLYVDELDLRLIRKKEAFVKLLTEKVVPYVKQHQSKPLKCFISYAWAKKGHKDYLEQGYHEYWVEQFALMLKAAGLEIFLDRWEDKKGKQINYFIEKMEDSDFIFIIGTPLYLEKYKNKAMDLFSREAVVRFEASLIQNTISYSTNHSERIIPILLSGKTQESFPPLIFRADKIPCNFTENDYFEELLKLIHDLYNLDNQDQNFKNIIEIFRLKAMAIDELTTPEAQKIFREEQIQKRLKKRSQIKEETEASFKNTPKIPEYLADFNVATKSIIWNIVKQDHLFVGREKLLEELHNKLQTKDNKTGVVSVCAGLGGVGKTQLALQYVNHSKYPYTLRAWFEAENVDQLKQQYIEFARILGHQDEKPSIKTALPYLKEWFSNHPGWLLVYDNVNNYEQIKEFLPENNGSIILTTRQQQWPSGFKMLDIDIMTEAESIALVQSLIKRKINEVEQEPLKTLVKNLGYLPLALAQASAYIHQNQITVIEYLDLYKKHTQKLLADNALPEGTNSLPVALAWNISLEAIAKESKAVYQEPLALNLLSVCAYLAPEKIPYHLLLTWLKESYPHLDSPELVLPKLVGQLWKYSIVHRDENGDITIHRLVQSVVRQQHHQILKIDRVKYAQLTSEWYITLIGSAHKEYSLETKEIENETRRTNLLPHLQALLSNYDLWTNLVPEFNLENILSDIGSIFYQNNDPESAQPYYQRALINSEKRYDKNHPMVSKNLINLAVTFGALGDAKKSEILLERALKINEKHYGKDHIEVASVLSILGLAYADLGNIKSSKDVLERSLTITEKKYGKNHLNVSYILADLAVVYLALGETIQPKEFLERAVNIQEKYYAKHNTRLAKSLSNLGRAYLYLGDSSKAKIPLERAVNIFKAYSKEDHITQSLAEMAKSLTALAIVYTDLNDPKYAKELLEQSLKIKEKYFGSKNHHQIAGTLVNLSMVNLALGDVKKSIILGEQSLKNFLENYGEHHFSVAVALSVLGNAYVASGDIERGKRYLERAVNIKKNLFGSNHRETAITLYYLIKTHIKSEQFKDTISFVQKYRLIFISNYGNEEDYEKHILTMEKLLGMSMSEYAKKKYSSTNYKPILIDFARF